MLATLRASAAPLAFLCPGSVRRGDVQLNETNEAAGVGTAAHEALRALAETGRLDWNEIPALAKKHVVPEDQVRILCAQARKLWPQLLESFKDAITEVELVAELAPGFILTGHVDLLRITGTVARGGDWKTGRKDSDYSQQLRAYCALILLENPDLTEVTMAAIWVRDAEIENYTMTRADGEAWVKQLLERVVAWDGIYHPGQHCAHCPRSHECEAANALIRRDVAAIADRDLLGRVECEIELMPAAEIVAVLAKADMVVKYASRVREAVKRHVQKHGDITANGVRLTIETIREREIDVAAAWPVLEAAGFGDEDFAEVIDLKPSRIEKQVAKKSPKGKGAANIRALNEKLEEAGAVSRFEVEKLTTKRA